MLVLKSIRGWDPPEATNQDCPSPTPSTTTRAKTRASSSHRGPTPLALASRCCSVGPLLCRGECMTTPDPSGEARGSRPQGVGASSLRPHSQCSAKTHDDGGRRAVQPRANKSSQRSCDEPTRLNTTVCPSRPKQQDEVSVQADKPAMRERYQQSHGPSDRPTLPGGRGKEGRIV